MIGPEALSELVGWCQDNGVQVISDEIYHGISYIGTRGECALAHDDSAVVISSFSKYWGMTGWRLGWAILPEALVGPAQNVTGNLSLCAPVPAQYAAVAAFADESYAECEAAVASFAGAREHVLSAAADLGYGEMAPPDGPSTCTPASTTSSTAQVWLPPVSGAIRCSKPPASRSPR